ncbi:MAG: DUF2085 domain-containing protein [Thermoplasmata archaeon]
MDLTFDAFWKWLKTLRRERLDRPSIVAFCITLFWFAGNVASPFLAPAGTIDLGNDGIVGSGDKALEISQIENGFARFFYNAGDANCHQHAERSLFLNGNQMPFCARCTAIFLGLALGVGILMFLALELNILWIILGLVPMALDGGIQLLTDYESSNPMRLITGGIAGIVTGIALGYIVSEMGKMAMHRKGLRKGS